MAYARKTPSGSWRGVAKNGRQTLATKTFKLKREALDWAERMETAAEGGLDVKAGKARIGKLLPEWLEVRDATVSKTTATTDKVASELIPATLRARSISSVTTYDVEKWLVALRQTHHLSDGSITRYRASLSSFFAWAMKDGRIDTNPVTKAQTPTAQDEVTDMHPLSESELERVTAKVAGISPHYARIVYVLGWIGVRWGEARSLRVSDVTLDPPSIRISRSETETYKVKTTKGRKARRVPMPDHVADVVRVLMAGKQPEDRLLTGVSGGKLWRHRMVETIDWPKVSGGRRIHDLRHTAACIWLSRGVDLATVSAWLGHASVSTTNRYLHHLGTMADHAGVGLLNAGGARGVRDEESELPGSLVELGGIEPPAFSLRMVHTLPLPA